MNTNIRKIELTERFIENLIHKTKVLDSKTGETSAYLSLMKVTDYLMLTTLGNWEATEIIQRTKDNAYFKDSKGRKAPSWNNEKIECLDIEAIPQLWISKDGQILMHDGRHRTAIAAQSMIPQVPVVIHCVNNEMKPVVAFDIYNLKDQYEKGKRKKVSVHTLQLVKISEEQKNEMVKVHCNSNVPQKDKKNLDRDFTI